MNTNNTNIVVFCGTVVLYENKQHKYLVFCGTVVLYENKQHKYYSVLWYCSTV